MGLPAGEQRVLDTIENELRITDQQLAAAFAAFTRFARGTRMPRPERLTGWRRLITRRRRWRIGLLRPGGPLRCGGCVQQAAQGHALGGEHATPYAVLADIPVPKRQREALGAHRARCADGDRRGRLVTSLPDLHAHRKPVFGIERTCRAAGLPDDLHPQELIGEWQGHRPI
jgi:hypothetical protein